MDRDVPFAFDKDAGRIEHADYSRYCLTLNDAYAETTLGLRPCNESAERQALIFSSELPPIHDQGASV